VIVDDGPKRSGGKRSGGIRTPSYLQKFLASEIVKWRGIMAASGVTPQ
jgi:hypothetical protein